MFDINRFRCFPAFHLPSVLNAFSSDEYATYISLEPLGEIYRMKIHKRLGEKGRYRFGVLMDTGAPESAIGRLTLTRYIESFDLKQYLEEEPYEASLSGIGSGTATVKVKAKVPVGFEHTNGRFKDAFFQAQVLEGVGEKIPALYGLSKMIEFEGRFDLRKRSDGTFIYTTSVGEFKLHLVHGHLILPADWGGQELPSLHKFIADPLGIDIFMINESEEKRMSGIASQSEQYAPQELLHASSSTQIMATTSVPAAVQVHLDKQHAVQHVLAQAPSSSYQTIPQAPPGLSSKGQSKGKFKNFELDNNPGHNTEPYNRFNAFVHRTHAWMSKLAKRNVLLKNETYRKRYQPLPPDTPPPQEPGYPGKWDFWELWAGKAHLTQAAIRAGLHTGPPITRERGWDISLKPHQLALWHLYKKHRPTVVFAAPTCSPWSQANTNMDVEVKRLIREAELSCFEFFVSMCEAQAKESRHSILEQPAHSELLQQKQAQKMTTLGATDHLTHMCAHGMIDPESHLPYFKPTVLRSTIPLKHVVKTCSCGDKLHERLRGHLKDGRTRTSVAQSYPRQFCERLVADIAKTIKGTAKAYPLENPALRLRPEEVAYESDEEVERVRRREQLEEQNRNAAQGLAAARISRQTREQQRLNQQEEQDRDNEVAVDVLESLARENAPPAERPMEPQWAQPTAKRLARPEPVVVVEGEERKEEDEDRLAPVLLEEQRHLEAVTSLGVALPTGGQRTLQTGKFFSILQELYSTPSNKILKLAVLVKRPLRLPVPEPLIARQYLTSFRVLTQQKETEDFAVGQWLDMSTFSKQPMMRGERPIWILVLFASDADTTSIAEHIAASPIENIEQARAADQLSVDSLPQVLKTLVSGETDEKIRLLLTIHKRLMHKAPAELRVLLHRAGIPIRVLSLVEDAVSMCVECRRWKGPHANPAVKTSISNQFNDLAYADIVFFQGQSIMILIVLDDSLRVVGLAPLLNKDLTSLCTAFRKCWLSHYGPPKRIRTDTESALANDAFGVFLESIGTKRELILAKDSHSMLGPLDNKVRILRHVLPRILDSLSTEGILVNSEDLACEGQYLLNSQLTYGGVAPMTCLLGVQPREFWRDDDELTLSMDDPSLPFYRHALIRHKSIAAFHEGLLRFRLERAMKTRPRTDFQQSYTAGMLVDIWIKSLRKDIEGWRGPGVVLGPAGDGRICVRWQSVLRDVQLNHVRPHILVLPPAPQQAGPALPMPPPEGEAEVTGFIEVNEARQAYFTARDSQELYLQLPAEDQLSEPLLPTLMSVAAFLSPGQQQFHVLMKNGKSSADCVRDNGILFSVGREYAKSHGIKRYVGIVFQSGRRHFIPPAREGIKSVVVLCWLQPSMLRILHSGGTTEIDYIKEGICTASEVHLLRSFVLLEGNTDRGKLSDLLPRESLDREPDPEFDKEVQDEPVEMNIQDGRVREGEWPIEDMDPGPSVSEAGDFESSSAWLARTLKAQLPPAPFKTEDDHETLIALIRHRTVTKPQEYPMLLGRCQAFPVNRMARPLTTQEEKDNEKEVFDAKAKEMKSWIETDTIDAEFLPPDHTASKQEITARWVLTWKQKDGKWGVKARLVIRGFQQAVGDFEDNKSPTASRLSHKLLMFLCVQNSFETLASLDVSTAFLKGLSFEELKEVGKPQEEVKFRPPVDVFKVLASLAPEVYQQTLKEPGRWRLRLKRSAYGLRNAPLLWYLRLLQILKDHGWKCMAHDACFLYKTGPEGEIIGLLTIHVDDLLFAGSIKERESLKAFLTTKLGDIKCEAEEFLHFGMKLKYVKGCITASQAHYIADLAPIEIPHGALEKPCPPAVITSYRALVSAISWVSVTSPEAAAIASMSQSNITNLLYRDVRTLNELLEYLRTAYTPLQFEVIPKPWRILSVNDSSLANIGDKYSQGAQLSFIQHDSQTSLGGPAALLDWHSSKSKRVCTSSMHAETLSAMVGVENSQYLQGFMNELLRPGISAMQLANLEEDDQTLGIILCTDCADVYEAVTSQASPSPSNKSLTIYLQAIRSVRLKALVWIDTRNMSANSLTKLPIGPELRETYQGNYLKIPLAYRWNRVLTTD